MTASLWRHRLAGFGSDWRRWRWRRRFSFPCRMSLCRVVAVILLTALVTHAGWGVSDAPLVVENPSTWRPKSNQRPTVGVQSDIPETTRNTMNQPTGICPRSKTCRCRSQDFSSSSSTAGAANTNILWYSYGDQAGLDDRRQVLFTLANLAASLCARLVVPPPVELLDAERHFTTVSPALQWNDLLRISNLHCHNHHYHNKNKNETTTNIAFNQNHNDNDNDNYNILWELRRPQQEFWSTAYGHYQRWTTRAPQDLLSHFLELQQYIESPNDKTLLLEEEHHFLWEVKVSWHFVKKQYWPIAGSTEKWTTRNTTFHNQSSHADVPTSPLPAVFVDAHLEPTRDGCLSIDPWGVPLPMQQMIQSIWQDEIAPATSFGFGSEHGDDGRFKDGLHATTTKKAIMVGFLHIRRGDSTSRCDTSLDKMQSYLTCSLKTLPNDGMDRPILLLFASDETNEQYRQGVARMAENLIMDSSNSTTYRIKVVDLDVVVSKEVQRAKQQDSSKPFATARFESNYYIYAIESVLKRQYVDFVLERRQTLFCDECQDLSNVSFRSNE